LIYQLKTVPYFRVLFYHNDILMKKSFYIVLWLCIILIIITAFSTTKKLDNPCQTGEIQINQKELLEKEKTYISPEEHFILPFTIINNENGQRILNYEKEFIQNIENTKKAHLQRNVITEYITDVFDQQKFLSDVEEPQFYELSTEEKVKILDMSNANTMYRFWDDVIAMSRKKIYHFGEFQLALCWGHFSAWIPCINDFYVPFQIVERKDAVLTGVLIRKIWETQRHTLHIPQIGNHPVSMWVKNGKLFLAIYTVPEGEYFWANDWYGAIYTLEKVRWNEEEKYSRVFQQCYDTAYKNVSWEYILWDDSLLSWSIFWDNWLFMEDTILPPKKCFSGQFYISQNSKPNKQEIYLTDE
jgi:hypothetical protein